MFRIATLSAGIALALASPVAAAAAQDDINVLKDQLKKQQTQINALADQLESKGTSGSAARWYDKTTLGGYGEANFKRIEGGAVGSTRKRSEEFDAYRFVVFVGHQFTDKLRFASELEVEHAYVKDTDTDKNDGTSSTSIATTKGYVAVEQLFIEYQYLNEHSVSAGQMLIPVGIINETHEPDTYYGVFRPRVESIIIPSTWFETGVKASGAIIPGLSYAAMISGGLKSTDGIIANGRQRGAQSEGSDLAYTTQIKYTGLPGTEFGVAWHRETDMNQNTIVVEGEDLEGDLAEAHIAFNKGPFGLRTVWAEWDLNDDALATANQKRSQQTGWYIEPSWKVIPTVGLFARYSEWDTEKDDHSGSEWQESAVGVNWWLHERVVAKADLQRRDDPTKTNRDQDGFNVGIGWSF